MSSMLDALRQIEVHTAPVILSLPIGQEEVAGKNEECGMMHAECPGDSPEQAVQHSSFSIQHSSAHRFEFPALSEQGEESPCPEPPPAAPSEPPAPPVVAADAPDQAENGAVPHGSIPLRPAANDLLAIWPLCEETELSRAYAKAAATMIRQMPAKRPIAIALTSPGDGDGKTGVLAALAPELARRTAETVLAVDANFRKPDLSQRVMLPTHAATGPSALIYPTSVPDLFFLPSLTIGRPRPRGGQSPQPSDIASRLADLLEQASLVVLDLPSLEHREAAPLARCCDGVYLVVRLGYTSRRAVAEAAEVLRGVGVRLLGCVTIAPA